MMSFVDRSRAKRQISLSRDRRGEIFSSLFRRRQTNSEEPTAVREQQVQATRRRSYDQMRRTVYRMHAIHAHAYVPVLSFGVRTYRLTLRADRR
jgi:hypothetical protein